MNLRQVDDNDCELLFFWANDKEARRQSTNTAEIPYSEHKQWFARKMLDPDCHMLVGRDDNKLVGIVRFDVSDGIGTVSITVDPKSRRRGYGTALIEAGCRYMRTRGIERFRALVRPENEASVKMFQKAWFKPTGTINLSGVNLAVYEVKPPSA